MHGPNDPDPSLDEPVTPGGVRRSGPVNDLSVRETVAIAPLIALIVFLGVYPKPIIDIIRPAVNATLAHINQNDPPPSAVPTGVPQ